jgi:uncharacterized protein YjbI with pentapeptide repeats
MAATAFASSNICWRRFLSYTLGSIHWRHFAPPIKAGKGKAMANPEQLAILRRGVEAWNKWREDNPDAKVDLNKADLSEANLSEADFSDANLEKANLSRADLSGANFINANLYEADLSDANLNDAYLSDAHLEKADLSGAHLNDAYLSDAYLKGADLRRADLRRANLSGAILVGAVLLVANLRGANLIVANLSGADLVGAKLSGADLRGAILNGANLYAADLSEANLTKANLVRAQFVRTNVSHARISGSYVYGINVWDLKGKFEEKNDLIITLDDQPAITVDNIEVAQFIYLVLNNEKIRDVINTITSKSVLILGRFAVPERKEILDALRNKLREYDLLPIVFDFDRPTDKDFTETIKTLAGLSYFVIADITNPKSSPLELQATVPDYQIPFVPIIQEGEQPFAMMVDLQKKYNWVLDTVSYDTLETLIEALKPAIIDRAIQKHNELRLIKAQQPKILSASDFIKDKGLDSQSG